MEPEYEENQYASIRHSSSHLRHLYSFVIGGRAERRGGALQVEMCCVPWRRRSRFGDGEENGRPRFHNGRRAGNVGRGARHYHYERQEQDAQVWGISEAGGYHRSGG